VTGMAVKGQDERPLQGALDSHASHRGALCSTEENMQGFTARQTKRRVLWVDRVASRRSCAILTPNFLWKCREDHKEQ
jgi:hypothetical protein